MTDTAVTQLAEIRESWGDLLAAIDRRPAAEWPPRQPSVQHLTAAEADADAGPVVGRLPLILRQHPAPLNVDALDAAMRIETSLFDLADRIAAATQRPVRTRRTHHPDGGSSATTYRPTHRISRTDRDDPNRWHTATHRTATLVAGAGIAEPGSRALGLHWAARWIEDRLAQPEATPLHRAVRGVLREHAERTVADAHGVLLRALGRDGRATVLTDPCPWCHGTLTARTTSGDPWQATVTCDTGPTCTAPTPYDTEARRTWHGPGLVQLYGALTAARTAA